MDAKIEREMLQNRVDLANEACALCGDQRITLESKTTPEGRV